MEEQPATSSPSIPIPIKNNLHKDSPPTSPTLPRSPPSPSSSSIPSSSSFSSKILTSPRDYVPAALRTSIRWYEDLTKGIQKVIYFENINDTCPTSKSSLSWPVEPITTSNS